LTKFQCTATQHDTMQYGGSGDDEGSGNSSGSGVSNATNQTINMEEERNLKMQQSTVGDRGSNQQQNMPTTVITGRRTPYKRDNVTGGNRHGGASKCPPSGHFPCSVIFHIQIVLVILWTM